MRNHGTLILALAAGLTSANGQTSYIVSLDAAQEVPAATSRAMGLGTLTLNANNTLSYNIDYIGLTADFTLAQLHAPAAPGATAPSVLALTNSPNSTRAGKLKGTTQALTAAQKNDLQNGQTYANILTATLPEGEIRGQVTQAKIGPFDSENWPSIVDANKQVHYVSTDRAFQPPGANWLDGELQILSGGDQVTQRLTIGGHTGVKLTGTYFNVADSAYPEWADQDTIDIPITTIRPLPGRPSDRRLIKRTGSAC